MQPVLLEIGNFNLYSYGSMISLGSLVVLFLMYREAPQQYKKFPGFNMWSIIILYSLLRVSVEFFREKELLWGPLSLAQVFSVFLITITTIILGFVLKSGKYNEA